MGYSLNRIVADETFSFVGIQCVFSLGGGVTHFFICHYKNLYSKKIENEFLKNLKIRTFENVKIGNEVIENLKI